MAPSSPRKTRLRSTSTRIDSMLSQAKASHRISKPANNTKRSLITKLPLSRDKLLALQDTPTEAENFIQRQTIDHNGAEQENTFDVASRTDEAESAEQFDIIAHMASISRVVGAFANLPDDTMMDIVVDATLDEAKTGIHRRSIRLNNNYPSIVKLGFLPGCLLVNALHFSMQVQSTYCGQYNTALSSCFNPSKVPSKALESRSWSRHTVRVDARVLHASDLV